jgi:hypothetical protein
MWDDPFADDIDMDDSDDEFGSESKQTLLSADDPRLLEQTTQDALAAALSSLSASFAKIVRGLVPEGNTASNEHVSKAVFILRLVREIKDRIPRLRLADNTTTTPHATPFTKDIQRPLHRALAAQIVHPEVQAYRKSLLSSGRKSSPKSQILWEGNPALPIQPSPTAFRYLSKLVKSMAHHGSDLWVPEAVRVLKVMAGEEMERVWEECVAAATTHTPTENSPIPVTDSAPGPSVEQGSEDDQDAVEQVTSPVSTSASAHEDNTGHLTQLAFDMLYIQRYLSTTANRNGALESVYEHAHIDEGMQTRLKKSAADYARKTYLLFALLA